MTDVRQTSCPKCSSEAILDMRDLGDLGYVHEDQRFSCTNCGETWTHGVPLGEYDDDPNDLWCDVCDLGFMHVHRVNPAGDAVRLHLKCSHHHEFDCPGCGDLIVADGVRSTRDGGRVCPYCQTNLDRDDVPYCYYFDDTIRELDRNIALIGYPAITGNTEESTPYDA